MTPARPSPTSSSSSSPTPSSSSPTPATACDVHGVRRILDNAADRALATGNAAGFFGDGIHPNDAGSLDIAPAVRRAMFAEA